MSLLMGDWPNRGSRLNNTPTRSSRPSPYLPSNRSSSWTSRFSLFASILISLYVLVSFFPVSSHLLTFSFTSKDTPVKLGPLSLDDNKAVFSDSDKRLWKGRADEVKQSFVHAWRWYETYAWASDELKPVTHQAVNNLNGWGVTIVDSLDTLLIMDLRDQFDHAMQHVENMKFLQAPNNYAPFFETIIRYLGGLLSAYALVADQGKTSGLSWKATIREGSTEHAERNRITNILKDRADTLANALMPAFQTPSGLPMWGVNTMTGKQTGSTTGGTLLAEIASFQMEFKYLAHITERKSYFDVANHVINKLEALQKTQLRTKSSIGGMLPTIYRVDTGNPVQEYISVGSLADSAYEYLLKGYLLSGRTEPRLLDMYLSSVETALEQLTFISPERNLTFITDSRNNHPSMRFEHLSCFFPGLLALGVESLSTSASRIGRVELSVDMQSRHRLAAEGIAESCWLMYRDNPTTLGSEEVFFDKSENIPWWSTVDQWERNGRPTTRPRGIHGASTDAVAHSGDGERDYSISLYDWRMRPETIESLYLMFRLTGDPIWRDRCYAIYQGVEKYSRVTTGYSALFNASVPFTLDPSSEDYQSKLNAHLKNDMPSYALAETFKNLYLCMLDPDESKALLPSDKWIFNTEAHPLPVFSWSAQEMTMWGINT